jgi:phycocyanobilin:ferredoxin oxidoreductase
MACVATRAARGIHDDVMERATTAFASTRQHGCARRVTRARASWRSDEAPDGLITHTAEALVARGRAGGARRAELEPSMASLRPNADADARLCVENVVYEDDVFRKMHCELAWGDGGFEVLHAVMYPWAERAAPLFAADMVSFAGRVSLCIADVAPVTEDLSLSSSYARALAPTFDAARRGLRLRELPDWGREILGPLCVCVGPKVGPEGEREVEQFLNYLFALHDAYVALARAEPISPESTREKTLAAQTRFCDYQLENIKTRRALERAFGVERADRYMRDVLFDVTARTPCAPAP